MTYTVQCPGCEHEFKIEKTVEQLADEDDLTTCPECLLEWESEYDENQDSLELIEFADDEEEEGPENDDSSDEEDEDADDEEDYD